MNIRIALLFQTGNFVGREYYRELHATGMEPSLMVAVGTMPQQSIAKERERTAGRWNPPDLPEELPVQQFESLKSPALWRALRDAKIDVAVQGGIGILAPDMLRVPTIGFLNVHPGKLPQYRGNSCPEWAIYNGDEIYSTAHLIDDGIDTGPIVCHERYPIRQKWDYHDVRAHLYAHCAKVMVQALHILDASKNDPAAVLTPQDRDAGHYWRPISVDQLATAVDRLSQGLSTGSRTE